jgi:predicted acyltransferase
VGVSIVLSFKSSNRPGNKWPLFKEASGRAVRLFLLGFMLQGIHFFGYADIRTIRICGILQRISFGFLVIAIFELVVPIRVCFY